MRAPARVTASSPFAKPSLVSPEFIVILAVGVALGGVILQGLHGLDKRIGRPRRPHRRPGGTAAGGRSRPGGDQGPTPIIRDYIAGRNMRPDDPGSSGGVRRRRCPLSAAPANALSPREALLALQAVELQEALHRGEADGDALGGQRGPEARSPISGCFSSRRSTRARSGARSGGRPPGGSARTSPRARKRPSHRWTLAAATSNFRAAARTPIPSSSTAATARRLRSSLTALPFRAPPSPLAAICVILPPVHIERGFCFGVFDFPAPFRPDRASRQAHCPVGRPPPPPLRGWYGVPVGRWRAPRVAFRSSLRSLAGWHRLGVYREQLDYFKSK